MFHSAPYLVFRNGLLLNIDNPEEALEFDVGLFCVLPDRKQDILWVGTDGQGIQMYYDKYNRFSGIQLEDLPIVMRNPVRSIYTEDEKTILARGRNATIHSKAKNATHKTYLEATALESMLGYLYLYGHQDRLKVCLDRIIEIGDSL